MKSFEEFVESRRKIDASTQKMTEQQWKQAYAAYRSSRERVREGRGESSRASSGTSSKRRRRSEAQSSLGLHEPSALSELSVLKKRVREQSAYEDLRLIVDVLAWVAVAVLIGSALLRTFSGYDVYFAIAELARGGLGVIAVFVLKFLLQVLMDLSDIALYRLASSREPRPEKSKGAETSEENG